MAAKRFTSRLVQDDRTSGCAVKLPFDPKETFGRARAPVKVTINGFTFRTTTCSMAGAYWIPVNKVNRTGAGIAAGDKIAAMMELDATPRVVTAPPDFAKALRKSPAAEQAWQRLSYSHRKAYVEAIEEAKQAATRQRRITRAVEMLARGKNQ
jgi:hypothetical protein